MRAITYSEIARWMKATLACRAFDFLSGRPRGSGTPAPVAGPVSAPSAPLSAAGPPPTFGFPDFDPARSFATGYHGTREDHAYEILSTTTMRPSTGPGEWLGDGVYLWEDGEDRASRWAEWQYPGSAVSVLRVGVRLGRCLDFNNSDLCWNLLIEAAERLGAVSPLPTPAGAKHFPDRAVIEFLCAYLVPPADTVRAWLIEEGNPPYAGSGLLPAGLQLCVRQPTCIESIELSKTWQAPPRPGAILV